MYPKKEEFLAPTGAQGEAMSGLCVQNFIDSSFLNGGTQGGIRESIREIIRERLKRKLKREA